MQGKRPTREQRKVLTKNKLDTYKWLVQKDMKDSLQVVNVDSGEKKVISK